MDQMTTDLSALRESVADISSQVGKLQQQMIDIGNAVRTIQTPPRLRLRPGRNRAWAAVRGPVVARPPPFRQSPPKRCIRTPIATAAAEMTIWRCRSSAII